MLLIHDHLHDWNPELPLIRLAADRNTLAKRRWRGLAEDGTEFGFDLEHPLVDGDVYHVSETAVYSVRQTPEPVLEVSLGEHPAAAARLGWMIGNLHFQIAIENGVVLAIDDPAIRQLLTREHIEFKPAIRVFRALGGGHSH
ncbi:MAG: urease accessory protein UreE [Chthoniobacteraceae bacterium]|nr:urease accessory protein UreE [Chthoniobacteraceae bacterium]